jgi:hypothetical protein
MDPDIKRVEFDATLDDFVDVNMRMVKATATYRQARSSYRWLFALVVAGTLAVVILRGDEVPSYLRIAMAALVAAAGGLVSGIFGGRFYDSYVSGHYRRMLRELFGTANALRCEFELRDEILWSRTIHSEVSFPWSRLTRVQDLPGAIELWFSPGLVVIRDRAFETPQHRETFLQGVRKHRDSASSPDACAD